MAPEISNENFDSNRFLRSNNNISPKLSSEENPSSLSTSSSCRSPSILVPLLSPSTHVVNISNNSPAPSRLRNYFLRDSTTNSNGRVLNLINLGQHERPPYQDFVCGLGAALMETSITYPLNKLIFRQQLLGITAKQSIAQLRQEGVRYIYRGLLFPLLQKGASRSLMFGMYDEYRRLLGCRRTRYNEIGDPINRRHTFTSCHALAAFLAGATEASLTPLERVQVLMQNTKYHVEFKNTFDALRKGLRSYGIREYYRGLSMILLRNGFSNVVFFSLRTPIKELFVGDRLSWHELSLHHHLMTDFFSGAVLGASLSTMFYPLNVIKARMQSRLGGEFEKPWTVLYKILKEREFSIRHLYRGVTLNFTRSLLTWGFTNAGYEFLQRYFFINEFSTSRSTRTDLN